jgi:hypothetical protein
MRRPIGPTRKIIGNMIVIWRAMMMRRRGTLRQINVVKKSVIFKVDINPASRARAPAIAPAAGKRWAMRQNQLPVLMIPAAIKVALTPELHGLILVVVANLPGDIPAMAHEIIKAEWQL